MGKVESKETPNRIIDLGEDDSFNSSWDDFVKLMLIRNSLVYTPLSSLLDNYSDIDEYTCFLDSLVLLFNNDSGFLLLIENFYDRIFRTIDLHRFDADEDVKKTASDIIYCINSLKTMSQSLKDLMIIQYKDYHEEMRQAKFNDYQDLLDSLAFDAIVFFAITKNRPDLINDETYFLYSVCYFTKCFPELFYDDSMKQRTLDILSNLLSRQPFYKRDVRKYTKSIIERVQKVKKQ